jgi:hypothetical protein
MRGKQMGEREEICREDNRKREKKGYHDKSGGLWYGGDQGAGVKKKTTIVK